VKNRQFCSIIGLLRELAADAWHDQSITGCQNASESHIWKTGRRHSSDFMIHTSQFLMRSGYISDMRANHFRLTEIIASLKNGSTVTGKTSLYRYCRISTGINILHWHKGFSPGIKDFAPV
jgi:hypothetical protein